LTNVEKIQETKKGGRGPSTGKGGSAVVVRSGAVQGRGKRTEGPHAVGRELHGGRR